MSGPKRVINPALIDTTYTAAASANAEMLTDASGWSEARPIPIKLLGNVRFQGSYDNVPANFVDKVESDHNYIRFSTDGGIEWISFKRTACDGSETFHNQLTLTPTPHATLDEVNQVLTITFNGTLTKQDILDILELTVLEGDNTGDQDLSTYALLTDLEAYILNQEGYGLIPDEDLAKLQNMGGIYTITLPSASTVAGRISAAVEGTDYPSGWVLTADGIDLKITHSLNRRVVLATVFSDNLGIERQLYGNAAYSGLFQEHTTEYNEVTIEALATVETPIVVHLMFGAEPSGGVTPPPATTIPTVLTNSPYNISTNSFDAGGTVTADGGESVFERGVCYGRSSNPTIYDSRVVSGEGLGSFQSNLTGLLNNTRYYYRAYAININGVAYGQQIYLTTQQ